MKIRITEEEVKIKEKKIKELSTINDSRVEKKAELYEAYLKELSPVINFLKKGRYYFTHPDLEEGTTRGPILGKDKRKNILYVYDVDDNWVKEINMYNPNEEPKKTILSRYFSLNDFEEAMKGLITLVDYQDKIISQIEEENNIAMAQIKKYEKIIEESQ